MRQSHGRSRPDASARAGVKSQGKSGPIELDGRKVVRLEVRGARSRIHAHDFVRVDADDVGRAAEAHRHRFRRSD